MTNYIIKQKEDSFEDFLQPQYNLLIIKNYILISDSDVKKLQPFRMKWKRKKSIGIFNCTPKIELLINNLIYLFENLTTSNEYIVELERINDGACRQFHTDNLNLRLICTLYGAGGTEWLEDNNVDFSNFNINYDSVEEKHNAIIKDKNKIHRADIGDVLFMKGSASNSKNGLVHRSFPLNNNESRWVLKVSERFI